MAARLVTSRPIQNAHTGLDLWVPEYQEIRGRMMTGHVEYQIVVVTNLPVFKSAKHKPEDVVQFVVFRKYSEIEEFYQKISARYPNVSLPSFPRKVLFVGETDIRERRAAFNDLVKAISKEKELVACPELLDFLGMRSSDFVDLKGEKHHMIQPEEGDFFKNEESSVEELLASIKRNKPAESQENEDEEEEEEEEEVDFDPLGIIKTKRIKNPVKAKKAEEPNVKPKSKMTLFDDEVDPDAELFETSKEPTASAKKHFSASHDIKLFEEQDLGGSVKVGDSLLLPSACSDHSFKPSRDEDIDELLRVEEGLEKLLNLGVKSKSKPKPKIPAKPTFLKEPNKSNHPSCLHSEQKETDVQAMNETDILQYIKENECADNDSLSLF